MVEQLFKIGFHDIRELSPGRGTKLTSDSDEMNGMIIQESISKGGRSLKVKTNDRMREPDRSGHHLGMFVDRKEISGKLDLADLLPQAWAKKETD